MNTVARALLAAPGRVGRLGAALTAWGGAIASLGPTSGSGPVASGCSERRCSAL